MSYINIFIANSACVKFENEHIYRGVQTCY